MSSGPLLVTGGAGYVGGFTVRELLRRGENVVVLDDLSTGHRETVPDEVEFVEGDVRDTAVLAEVFGRHRFDAVLHFAASAMVGESVADPRKYWENNVAATLALLGACVDHSVAGFVFSSSCSVYGEPGVDTLTENLPRAPLSPYARTKAAVEQMLEDFAGAGLVRSFRLRYFNAAGGAEDGSLGEDHDPETHLVPLTLRAAADGTRLAVFGTDWPTRDGTCIRDYVHVEDLAHAHATAVDRLRDGHPGAALNLGTGRGATVLEVIGSAERVTGLPVAWDPADRRPGDGPRLVAAQGSAAEVLDFHPRYTELDDIVRTAWAWWQRHHPSA